MPRGTFKALFAAGLFGCVTGAAAAPVPGAPTVYQNTQFKFCGPVNFCHLVFAKVPVNKVLRINNIQCSGSTGQPSVIVHLYTGAPHPSAGPQPAQTINRFFVGVTGGLYTLTETLFLHIPESTSPRVTLSTGSPEPVDGLCTLTGQLLPAQ